MTKDSSITELLMALELERRGWRTVDSWDADLFAIGIKGSVDPVRGVYVCTFAKAPGRYDYECEIETGDASTDVVDKGVDVTYEHLAAALEKHLG